MNLNIAVLYAKATTWSYPKQLTALVVLPLPGTPRKQKGKPPLTIARNMAPSSSSNAKLETRAEDLVAEKSGKRACAPHGRQNQTPRPSGVWPRHTMCSAPRGSRSVRNFFQHATALQFVECFAGFGRKSRTAPARSETRHGGETNQVRSQERRTLMNGHI